MSLPPGDDPATGEVVLSFPREWEAWIYSHPPTNVWDELPSLTVPTLAVRGTQSDTLTPDAWALWQNLQPAATFVEMDGVGHMLTPHAPTHSAASARVFRFIPRRSHTSTIASASARAVSMDFMHAPLPPLMSRTIALAPVASFFDTMRAAYCIDSVNSQTTLEDLAKVYLDRDIPRLSDLLGSGRNARVAGEIDREVLGNYLACHAGVLVPLKERLSERMAEVGVVRMFSEIEIPLTTVLSSLEACGVLVDCLLYTSPSPRDRTRSRMPSSACKKKTA